MSSRWLRKNLLLALGILISTLVEAQSDFRPGYIVTLDGDTINGLLSLRGEKANAKSCIFKKDPDSEKVTYTPDQIRAYRFPDLKGFLSSASLNYSVKDNVFLEYVAEGPLTILYYKDDDNVEHFLASQDTVTIGLSYQLNAPQNGQLRSKFEKYKGQLKYLLGDEPALFPLIEKLNCNKKDLTRLAKEYRKLRYPHEELKVSDRKKGIKFKLAIQASGVCLI